MKDEDIYRDSFIYLLHKITPNVRYIFMEIDRKNSVIILYTYFENQYSDVEVELIEDISDNIIAMVEENFTTKCVNEVTAEPYLSLKKTEFLLYGRYEGF